MHAGGTSLDSGEVGDSSVELSPSPTHRDSTNSSGHPSTPDLPELCSVDGNSGVEEGKVEDEKKKKGKGDDGGKVGSQIARQKGVLFGIHCVICNV